MAESKKEVQIAFRVDRALRNRFYAALKGQDLDIADVMRPVVETVADAGPDGSISPEISRENPTTSELQPSGTFRDQIPQNVSPGILKAVQEIGEVLQNGSRLVSELEDRLTDEAGREADRSVSEIPEKLRRGGKRVGNRAGNPPAGKKKTG